MAPDGRRTSSSDDLRTMLHGEIEEKSRGCGHRRFTCHLPRLGGFSRCKLHILEDSTAPYRRCKHTQGRQCPQPVHINDSGYCFEHARGPFITKMRNMAKKTPKPGPETKLLSLQHYIAPEATKTESEASQTLLPSNSQTLPVPNPFNDIDAVKVNSSIGPSILDCWSESSDEDDNVPRRCGGVEEDSSGAEDTQLDIDPLRFAGIYTVEEVVNESTSALKRLKTLYVGQMHLLHRQLKESRRNYLYGLKSEREIHCSIHAQGASTSAEKTELATLKAMNSYHRRHGVDAVLQKKVREKRNKMNEGISHRPSQHICCYTEGGVKCSNVALPLTRYCVKHILNDQHQVLFRGCGADKGGIVCEQPIPDLYPTDACTYHAVLQPYKEFSKKTAETDTDTEKNTGSSNNA